MAKTRLNKEKRQTLLNLAEARVRQTPLDTEKLSQEYDRYVKAYLQLLRIVRPRAMKQLPEADMKVLAKYRLTRPLKTVLMRPFEGGDSKAFQLHGTDNLDLARPFLRQWRTAKVNRMYDLRTRKMAISAPDRVGSPTVLLDEHEWKLVHELRDAHEGLELALLEVRGQYRKVLDAYKKLIKAARTFEDVVEVWPEANDVAHKIKGTGTSLSVDTLSDEVLSTIQANIEERQKNREAA